MKRSQGFSMVELLAVLGIVLMLGAVAVPVAAKVLRAGENVTCVSNLRQIGVGILCYAQDTGGVLPGPLYTGQYPWWGGNVNKGHYTQLASYLMPYLEVEQSAFKRRRDVFVCPAFKRVLKSQFGNSPVYRMNIEVAMRSAAGPQAPFGFPNSGYSAVFHTDKDFPPMRIDSLAEIVDEQGQSAQCRTWAMKDVDESDPIFSVYAHEYGPALPKTMVHHTHRNALFFDFHVEPVDQVNASLTNNP